MPVIKLSASRNYWQRSTSTTIFILVLLGLLLYALSYNIFDDEKAIFWKELDKAIYACIACSTFVFAIAGYKYKKIERILLIVDYVPSSEHFVLKLQSSDHHTLFEATTFRYAFWWNFKEHKGGGRGIKHTRVNLYFAVFKDEEAEPSYIIVQPLNKGEEAPANWQKNHYVINPKMPVYEVKNLEVLRQTFNTSTATPHLEPVKENIQTLIHEEKELNQQGIDNKELLRKEIRNNIKENLIIYLLLPIITILFGCSIKCMMAMKLTMR